MTRRQQRKRTQKVVRCAVEFNKAVARLMDLAKRHAYIHGDYAPSVVDRFINGGL